MSVTTMTASHDEWTWIGVPRYFIYCWDCDVVERMQNGVASEEFGDVHKTHKTQIAMLHPPGPIIHD
jgi:hypothetical protein